MKTYARVQDGVVVELFDTDGDIEIMFNASLVWVDVTGLPSAPTVGMLATEVDGDWSFAEPAPYVPPAPSAFELRDLRDRLLSATDRAINTLDDAGVPAASLRQFRQHLRDVPQQLGFPAAYNFPSLPEDVALPSSQQAELLSLLNSIT